ncbi:hypothetical protein QFZ20_002166 [Flavobacterium sp. W4I14]|nr:hypothetical protein [Flavobacterium sp. W4I14]
MEIIGNKMLKAGALYFSIIVAFLIAVICASLIMLAANYRGSYLKEMRMARLNRNMDSGIAYVLAGNENTSGSLERLDLFGDQTDSVWPFLPKCPPEVAIFPFFRLPGDFGNSRQRIPFQTVHP